MVNTDIQIRPIRGEALAAAGAVVGRALQDSPVYLRLLPANPAKRSGALGEMFAVVLRQTGERGKVFGAWVEGTLAGVCAVAEPGCCQPTAMEKIALGRAVAAHTSMGTALAYQRWLGAVALRDPEHRHWHLRTIAVEPGCQRRGIGTVLMAELSRMMEISREPAYLDTDRRDCLGFFEKSGFREYTHAAVQGAPHWFMLRPRS